MSTDAASPAAPLTDETCGPIPEPQKDTMSADASHPPHGRPTLAEAAGITTGADYWSTVAVDRLGLRSLRLADGPHGLRVQDDENPDHLGLGRSLPATCFPPAVTLASSWDRTLVEEVGAALGSEARAAGVDVVLGPGLNIKRSPLCGRNFEYFSEDPYLAGTLAAAMVRGIQSTGVAACVKHFAANNQETDRHRVSAQVDERTLREIYLRAFEVVLRESAPWSIMSAYNKINGTYASEDPWLLTEVLRSEWGYDGVVVSDWGAVHDPVDAVAAGLDLRMPGRPEDPRVLEAASDGTLGEEHLTRTFDRLRLLAERTLTATLPRSAGQDPGHEAHHALTRRAAAEAAVLLTNDGTLPLVPRAGSRVAVVGELARTPRYQGAGSSAVNPTRVVSGWDALRSRLTDAGASVAFGAGYRLETDATDDDLSREATSLAADADVVVLFLGLPGTFEAEGRDRTSIDLPANQVALVAALAATGTPVVVTLSNGSAVTTHAWRDGVNAVLELWLTGQAHGDSVADLLLGDVNPSGKLAETVPVRLADTPSFLDFPGENSLVTYGEGIHVGYRYYDARDLAVDHPFGHGLSYTTFAYSDLGVLVHDHSDAVALTAEVDRHQHRRTPRCRGRPGLRRGRLGDAAHPGSGAARLRQDRARARCVRPGADRRRPAGPGALPHRGAPVGVPRRAGDGPRRVVVARHAAGGRGDAPRRAGRGPADGVVQPRRVVRGPGRRRRAAGPDRRPGRAQGPDGRPARGRDRQGLGARAPPAHARRVPGVPGRRGRRRPHPRVAGVNLARPGRSSRPPRD